MKSDDLLAWNRTTQQTSDLPQLLSPQLLPTWRRGPVVIGGLLISAIALGFSFITSSHDNAAKHDVAVHPMLSVAADQAHGAFKVLPSNFQQSPGSVLVQLNMPEAEKRRLAEKLADGSVRLAAVTIWDTVDEDGDAVEISAAGFSQLVTIMHKPATFFLPLIPGGSVTIKAVRDGRGGVTLGVSTITGTLGLPVLAVGQSIEVPAL